ncbi:DUF4247 domain-containing protein [Actinomadura chibensis]|uniref:DUF4247 domain-containing protein n=1 Tax=Actinomadura chibensis TaxID=392828 RepID=A0A5D0NQY2_9ACTN|nr:DUF4247 domain-containing protein [Actinomadura chibensis]TYB46624.1 DUF4247 domain-containing protein [Actinomadura chibensis]
MNSRHRMIGGAAAAALTVLALGGCGQSQSSWIADKYTRAGVDTYRSPKSPPIVAGEINRKFKSIDRVDDLALRGSAGGIFLRYPKLVVGVLPDGTGSRITVDRPRGGYNRYYSHVSGRWASPGTNGWTSGGVASFRGGGPGSGK